MKVILADIWDLLVQTFKKAGDDEIFTFAAAIAFYTIFSIAPLLILIVSIGGFFLSEQAIMTQIQEFAGDFLDESIIIAMEEFMVSRIDDGAGFTTTIIASIVIIFGATTVISQMKTALNKIWNVNEVKINSVFNFVFNRVLSFLMILIFSALFVFSLITESILAIISGFIAEYLTTFEIELIVLASQLVTISFAILSFTLIFKILPDVHARWRDVFVGAIVTTLLFLLGKYLIGVYFSATGIDATYRAAGSLVIFVIWVYYNILIILLGAVFTQVYTFKYGDNILPYRFVTLKGLPKIERKD